MVDFESHYYPYEKVQTGYNTFSGAEEIPSKILTYLLDLPDAKGYEPVDDNERPRVRLLKYLWNDGERPLDGPMPTAEQKLSLVFDGNEPVLNTEELKEAHPKGYRVYPQVFFGQAQTEAQVLVKCYIGRVFSPSPFISSIGITFEILCNVNMENTTKTDAYARSYNIEQCIIESLNGVNMIGIGTFTTSRVEHSDNGSRALSDGGTNVGRELRMSLTWSES